MNNNDNTKSIDNRELVASELTEFYYFAKMLRVLNWEIGSDRIKEAISLFNSHDLEALLRAFDLCREIELTGYRQQINDQKNISLGLSQELFELKTENLELKKKNRELETKIKESSINSLDAAIAKLNELKNSQ